MFYFINIALKIELLRQRGKTACFCMFPCDFKFKVFILFLWLLDSSCQALSVSSWIKASVSTTATLVREQSSLKTGFPNKSTQYHHTNPDETCFHYIPLSCHTIHWLPKACRKNSTLSSFLMKALLSLVPTNFSKHFYTQILHFKQYKLLTDHHIRIPSHTFAHWPANLNSLLLFLYLSKYCQVFNDEVIPIHWPYQVFSPFYELLQHVSVVLRRQQITNRVTTGWKGHDRFENKFYAP